MRLEPVSDIALPHSRPRRLPRWIAALPAALAPPMAGEAAALGRLGDGVKLGVWQLDLEGGAGPVNRHWAAMLGQAPGALTLAGWQALLHPEDQASALAALEELAAGRSEAWDLEYRLRHRDGHWLWVQSRGGTQPGAGSLTVVHLDISQRKALEAQLERQARVLSAANEAIAITDPQGRYLFANRNYRRLYGQSPALPVRWQALYTPGSAERIRLFADPALERHGQWRGELALTRAQGAQVHEALALSRLGDGSLVWVVRDLTQQRRAEKELSKLRQALNQAHQQGALSVFAATTLHDAVNLHSVIQMSLAALREIAGHQGLGPEALAALDRADFASARTVELLSRIDPGPEAPGPRAPPERVDLREVVAHVLTLLSAGLDPEVEFRFDPPAEPAPVEAGRLDLLQAVFNVVSNARDACEARGGRVTITIAADDGAGPEGQFAFGDPGAGPRWRLRVEDSGMGVPAAGLEEMFHPYFTTKGSRGTGLGLPLVKEILRKYRGGAAVSSQPGAGTRFDLFFPASPPPDPAGPDCGLPSPVPGLAQDREGMHGAP